MIRKTFLLLLVAGSIGGMAAGCGSSSTPTTPVGTSPGGTGTAGSTTGGGGVSGGSPAAAAAVSACKNRINSANQLSPSLKAKLVKLCENITPANAKQIGKQVCREIVNTELPSGTPASIKNKALAACKKA